MGWIGLDWIGLDWIGLDWIGLGWVGLLTRLLVQLFINILRGYCSSEPFESTIHHIAFVSLFLASPVP
jgi:hypothetical protein